MTQEEIIRMAREAGLAEWHESIQQHGFKFADPENLERFFNLAFAAGVAHEREACAKACEEISQDHWNLYKGRPPYTGSESGRADPHEQGVSMGASDCAVAIRARGEFLK
ncbi:MAG: hypothetical protein ACR2IJ_09195 [Fluviibacter sp.]